MGNFLADLGKGLREPCPPNREYPVFGVPLNSFPPSLILNCPPEATGSTRSFDLSSLSPPVEVVMALSRVTSALGGSYASRHTWYKQGVSTPLFTFASTHQVLPGSWFSLSSYIGWVPWEIDANGQYYVDIVVEGPERFSARLNFAITGIPSVTLPPTPVGSGLRGLAEVLQGASTYFYSLYLEVRDWIFPMSLAAPVVYGLASLFAEGAARVSEVATWADEVTRQLLNLASLDAIKSLILGWFPGLAEVVSWWGSWWDSAWNLVESWWITVEPTVQGWIDTATQGLSELRTQWDQFWQVTFPNLALWGDIRRWWDSQWAEVERLIDSAFLAREGLWSGWQEMRDNVVTFFQDPLGFLEKRFADWFLGEGR